ncbi:MAG: radical SAM protein [DPANN group archaeon]|nr:radical SAM protein [DPANN group archaeon]
MRPVIIDAYSDEASGLGVPPYLGTYPRYLYGALKKEGFFPRYLTIDDLRLVLGGKRPPDQEKDMKTDIRRYNLTRPAQETRRILEEADTLLVSGGIHVPGKYLSAVPATFHEIRRLTRDLPQKKVLVGPAAFANRLEGGKSGEGTPPDTFDAVERNYLGIDDYDKVDEHAVLGAELLKEIPYDVMVELEAGRGCPMRCSFCLEPLKYQIEDRKPEPIISEVKALMKNGAEHFRFGKATCFYAYGRKDPKRMDRLLGSIAKLKPKTLHIDNANPNNVTEELTKIIVRHCTPGNIAAFGVESFDSEVIRKNRLNTTPERALKAIRIINSIGAERGENGMPRLLPGINIIFGLLGERKETHAENMKYLQQILDEGLLLRRINIRQVASFEGTYLHEHGGTKFVKKNRKHYWKWRNEIRQKIDLPMLDRLLPLGSVMKDVRMEIYDGKTTFGRQWGTYPLIVGVKGRLPLGSYHNIRVTKHMLRSVTGEAV